MENSLQLTIMAVSGVSIGTFVSVVVLALEIILSISLRISMFVEAVAAFFCLTIAAPKNASIAAPAISTKIQLNCISNAFLLFILLSFPFAQNRMVSLAFQL